MEIWRNGDLKICRFNKGYEIGDMVRIRDIGEG